MATEIATPVFSHSVAYNLVDLGAYHGKYYYSVLCFHITRVNQVMTHVLYLCKQFKI